MRDEKSPQVSIITACFNSGETIEETLMSVRSQTECVEHILVDGGSKDETLNLIKMVRGHETQVITGRDKGIYDALNKGISRAKGSIIGVLAADDLYADHQVVEGVLKKFEDSGSDAVFGNLDYVDRYDTQRVLRHWCAGEYSEKKMYWGWMPPHPAFFVRRECYEKFGDYRLDLSTAADYELMLRFLLVHKIQVEYVPRVLVKMRAGGASNASFKARLRANHYDRKAWTLNRIKPYPWTRLAKPIRKLGQWWAR